MLLGLLSQSTLELIRDSLVTTVFTNKIVNTTWHPDLAVFTFRKNTSFLDEDECNLLIRELL